MATADIRTAIVQGLADQSTQAPELLATAWGVTDADLAALLPQLVDERAWKRRSKRKRAGNDRVFSAVATTGSGSRVEVMAGVHSSPDDDVIHTLKFGTAPVDAWWPPTTAPVAATAPTGSVPQEVLERIGELCDSYFDHDDPDYRPGEVIDLGWDHPEVFANWPENPEWARDCRRVRALCMPDAPWWPLVEETLLDGAESICDEDENVRDKVVEILTDDHEWDLHAVGTMPDGYRFTAWVPLGAIEHAGLALVTGPGGEEGLAQYCPV